MEAKYGEAVRAGIAGGIVAAILFVMVVLIGIFVTDVAWFTLDEFLAWVLLAAVMLFTGVLAVSWARNTIANVDEAALVSALAGGVAGFLGSLAFTISIAVTQFFVSYDFLADAGRFEVLAARSILSLIFGGVGCCLMPVIILAGIVLAAIGGWIYWLATGKK
jgi:hypothetical protein